MSGITRSQAQNDTLRFLTLTSSVSSPHDIRRSFRVFVKRVRRAYGKFEYIVVKEQTRSGLNHLHMIYRGSYMSQYWISRNWNEIHSASIVYIQKIREQSYKLGVYLVKDMSKQMITRFSWSWGWVYPGFVKDWKRFVRSSKDLNEAVRRWNRHLIAYVGKKYVQTSLGYG